METLCAWPGGLLFEGNVLAYDPASNEVEWVPMQGTAEDHSQAEASARELSNMAPLTPLKRHRGWTNLGNRSESRGKSGAEECSMEAPRKKRMDQGYKGDSDEAGSDSTPDDLSSPASSQGGVHTTCAAIPWGATQVASAGQTSAHPRMKVALCLEVKNMPPA